MPPLALQLNPAASTPPAPQRSTSGSQSTKPDSTPSSFDHALRDVTKPKAPAQTKTSKTQSSKPSAKSATPTKPTSKVPEGKKPVQPDDPKPSDGSDTSQDEAHNKADQRATDQQQAQGDGKNRQPAKNTQAAVQATASTDKSASTATTTPPKSEPTPTNVKDVKGDKSAKRTEPTAKNLDDSSAQATVALQAVQTTTNQSNPGKQAQSPASNDASTQQPLSVTGKTDVSTDSSAAGAARAREAVAANARASMQGQPGPDADGDNGAEGDADVAGQSATAAAESGSDSTSHSSTTKMAADTVNQLTFTQALAVQQQSHQTESAPVAKAPAQTQNTSAAQQAEFAEANHSQIVSEIQGKLLPDGGAMNLRLNPPELGEMHVRVEVRDGVISASFSAEKDQTAKLLSHSLGDLKSSLEAQGITVEKLHVTQTPKDSQSTSSQNNGQGNAQSQQQRADADKNEQQRREMLQRMWKKLMKGQDPLDLLA